MRRSLAQLLLRDAVSLEEVVAWADRRIAEADLPEAWLCELAVSKDVSSAANVCAGREPHNRLEIVTALFIAHERGRYEWGEMLDECRRWATYDTAQFFVAIHGQDEVTADEVAPLLEPTLTEMRALVTAL